MKVVERRIQEVSVARTLMRSFGGHHMTATDLVPFQDGTITDEGEEPAFPIGSPS